MSARDLLGGGKAPKGTPGAGEGRSEAHDRHPCFAVRLELEHETVSVMYGSFVGSPAHHPSTGIQFVFEALHRKDGAWKEGVWVVTVKGSNLERIFHHLCLSKQRFIRVGSNEDEPEEGDVPRHPGPGAPEVTGISVTELPKAK
jgi:hypothetical protein